MKRADVGAALLLCLAGRVLAASGGTSCAALLKTDFSKLADAPTTLAAARSIEASADLPAHCAVQGFVAPQVHFDIRLPNPWNGKFLMQGCGGLCGDVQPATCDDALARGYAVAVTDMGHRAAPWQSSWAFNNVPAEIDFAFRATHVATVAAKTIVASHYGRAPERSYFRGCSTGGRQGLVAAQRFPGDYDGIIAGAPVLSETGVAALHLIWSGRANLGSDGQPILSADKVQLLHRAALEACDQRDGVRDSIIENPAACDFHPDRLLCRHGRMGRDCLSSAERDAAVRIYGGARDSAGRRLFPGGMPPGSEYEWVPNFVGRDGPALFHPDGPISELYQYLLFVPDPGPGHSARAFDFDRDPPRLAMMESFYNAQNPDLRAFRDHGGRLLLYQGWDDAEVPPALTLDYFQQVEATMGGREATQRFARLFMLPGVAHCRRGPGADTVDWLNALEEWVERDRAPAEVRAFRLTREQNYLGLPRPRFPLAPSDVAFERPIYPYPATAAYRGAGGPLRTEDYRRAR